MNDSKTPAFLITFLDLWDICKLKKNYIVFGILFFGMCGLLYALTRPMEYIAQGSFREKGKSSAGLSSNSLVSYLAIGTNSTNSEAAATLKSRTMLLKLIYDLDLQGTISKRSREFPLLKNFRENFSAEYQRFNDRIGPYFTNAPPALFLSNIAFVDESPVNIRVRFIDDKTFQIANDEEASQGTFGEPYTYKNSTFTINTNGLESVINEEYDISLLPIEAILKFVSAKISIESDKEDRNLLNIKYKDHSRYQAAKIINALMATYQDYLWKEQQLIMNKQVDYLYARHDEVTDRLRNMMNQHAENLSLDVATTGFPDTSTAMAFLAQTQQQYARELLAIELEVKHLQQIKSDGTLQYLKDQGASEFAGFNQILNKINDLKKQADTLDIALGEVIIKNSESDLPIPDLATQLAALNDQEGLYADATKILASLEKGKLPDLSSKLIKDPKYKVDVWYDNLKNCKPNSIERSNCLHYFISYISNLQRLFQVHSIAIEEQLTHQQVIANEYQGIDLATAGSLYISYNNELNNVEAIIKQMKFIVDRMGEPEFEISSLSNFLEDSVSKEMIRVASNLALSMRDRENRSLKELERVQYDLDLQKGFLLVHLNQMTQLHQLKKELLERKINSLRHATLALTRQEISVLDQHLHDHISARVNSLLKKQSVLEDHQQKVQKEMALLPQKWVNEKMIDQQMDLNKKMVEEVAKLVESKNIARNLELIQSAPLDKASPPPHPQPTRALLFTIVGAILGALLSITSAIAYTAYKGMPVTFDNMKAVGYKVLGQLSKKYLPASAEHMRDQDLNVLRRILNYLNVETIPQAALLVINKETDYSLDLANLMQKRGLKVVLLPIFLHKVHYEDSSTEVNGLLQYLEGTISFPAITPLHGIDQVMVGGYSRFTQELVCSNRFHELLAKLLERYDSVMIVTDASPNSPEVQALAKLVSHGVITLRNQTFEDLQNISYLSHFSFVFSG